MSNPMAHVDEGRHPSVVPVGVVPVDWSRADGPVLVAVDADRSSDAAVDFGADQAQWTGSPLHLIHVCPLRVGAEAVSASPVADLSLAEHHEWLTRAAHRAAARHPRLTIQTELHRGDTVDGLLATASNCAVLVIGDHKNASTDVPIRDVTRALIDESPVPLVIVKGGTDRPFQIASLRVPTDNEPPG